MNILVTGANGQLGNEMRILAKESQDNYIFTDVSQVEGIETIYLDITDLEAIRQIVKEQDVKAIVNCAAQSRRICFFAKTIAASKRIIGKFLATCKIFWITSSRASGFRKSI